MFIEIRHNNGRREIDARALGNKQVYADVTDAEWAQFEAYVWAYVRQMQPHDLDSILITPETHEFCHNNASMWIQPKEGIRKRGRPKKVIVENEE